LSNQRNCLRRRRRRRRKRRRRRRRKRKRRRRKKRRRRRRLYLPPFCDNSDDIKHICTNVNFLITSVPLIYGVIFIPLRSSLATR